MSIVLNILAQCPTYPIENINSLILRMSCLRNPSAYNYCHVAMKSLITPTHVLLFILIFIVLIFHVLVSKARLT